MANIRKKINKGGTVYRVDYYDPDGRRVRKDFPLKKDAEAYRGKVEAAKKEDRYHDVFDVKKGTRVTFNELADRYVENHQTQRCFSRLKYYLVKEYRATFGNRRLSDITFLDLETYRNRRKATPTRAGKPRTDATVNRQMSTLRHMLNKAVEWGMLGACPFEKGKRLMFKENNQRLRFLSEEEITRILDACSPHLKPIVEVAIHTGMRRGELLSLKWEQINNGLIYLTETKSGKPRQIPINDQVARVPQRLRQKNHLKSPFIFCGPDGKRFYDVRRSFTTACRKAGVEGFRFHDPYLCLSTGDERREPQGRAGAPGALRPQDDHEVCPPIPSPPPRGCGRAQQIR
jgi:integrase